ncbi:uncharacterized protein LOC126980772 isoform X2 [Eriocheir sinensis]|uniref:uncharacterized protein LOC126980772 isoform X2 n=1 Tax=Eriocheir sinensis TaxID=95602 RepID=UPI0021C9053C|nr:uncharacterized protein LOC126980772 isoform X2 [Eriocheir sinensis]XP_050687012.1 uncharacterized protein LOC126980772 isoform X2 [Eriocheir sinensis]
MPVFRIWCGDRIIRKSVVSVAEIEELKKKATQKLCLELVGPTKLVLEKCGTEVDDDEVLEEIADEVLLLLADGQTYTPSVAQQIPDSARSLVACTTGDVLQPSRSASDNEVASTSSSGTEAYASHKSSNTLSLPLPELSRATRDDLQQGDKSRRVWLQLIEESKNYYMKYCPLLDENPYGAYKIIGEMLAAYPSIEREGKHKWSQYAKALSQSIRTERFRRKRKSLPVTPQEQQLPPKRFTVGKHIVTDASNALPEEEFEKHVLEIQKVWNTSACSSSHVDMLLRESYCNRRQWLPYLPNGKLAPILEKFPCFQESSYVLREVERMLLCEVSTWKDRLEKIVEALSDQVPSSACNNDNDQHTVDIIRFIEKSVAFKKGKGIKSKSCFTVADFNISDADKNDLCSVHLL